MSPEQLQALVREQGPFVFERMFRAVEQVRERLDRACAALEKAGIPYAVVGGNAVAVWVATKDDGAVRNTRDVDILLRDEDLDSATEALGAVGFRRDCVIGVTVFLDGPDGKPSDGVRILRAGRRVQEGYVNFAPGREQALIINGKRIIELAELVRMKLNSYRDKDRVHLRDLIGVGLIDATWPSRFESPLDQRLQTLLDNPES